MVLGLLKYLTCFSTLTLVDAEVLLIKRKNIKPTPDPPMEGPTGALGPQRLLILKLEYRLSIITWLLGGSSFIFLKIPFILLFMVFNLDLMALGFFK